MHWVENTVASWRSMHTLQRQGVFILLCMFILHGCSNQTPVLNKNDELPVMCLTKPDSGQGQAQEMRFYYDYRDNRCKAFRYGGRKGRVPFQTLKDCHDHCVAE